MGGTLKPLVPEGFTGTPEQLQDFYRRPQDFSTQTVNPRIIYPGLADVESVTLQYDLGPGPWQTYISSVPAQTEDGQRVTHPSNAYALNLHPAVSKSDTYDIFSFWVNAEKLIRGSNNMLFPQELSIGSNVAWKKNQGEISTEVFGYQNHYFISQDGINYTSNSSKVSGSYNDMMATVKDNHVYTYENNPLPLGCNAYYRMGTHWGEPLPSTATVSPIPGDPFHALVYMDFGYTDTIQPLPTSSQRGSSFCDVKSGVGGSEKVTVKMKISIKLENTPQYRCEKNGGEWYYDNLAEIPNKFAVSDYTCIPCAADEKRDPNNPAQCIKACAPGLTSTDHGQTCQTIPDPTPSTNALQWSVNRGIARVNRPPAEAMGDEVCKTIENPDGTSSRYCFTCPASQTPLFRRDGRSARCVRNASKNPGADFNLLGIYQQAINGQCEAANF